MRSAAHSRRILGYRTYLANYEQSCVSRQPDRLFSKPGGRCPGLVSPLQLDELVLISGN